MRDMPNGLSVPASAAVHVRFRPFAASLQPANGWIWAFVVLGICWFFFFEELSDEWHINAQYSYGYAVPLLGLALLWRRWPERPQAVPGASPRVTLAGIMFLVLLPAIRVVLQANPEWRLLYWLHGFQVIGLSFCFLYWLGGGQWVGFFAPPILFMLIAVPWPMGLEQWAIQGLMRLVASLTVDVAGLLGIPAVQQGNLIETAVGVVGIDEACSGVRSLQSALMLSLFLGEMYRFTAARRLALLGASLVFDLLANLARTTFLVWAAANRGLAQMEAWHDAAGLLVMIIVLPSLLALAYWMKPRTRKPSPGSAGVPRTGASCLPAIPRWVGVLALLWIGAGEVGSETWYRVHETRLIATTRWSVAWPAQSPRFTKTAVPEKALAILRCSNSDAAAWGDDAGDQWSGFLLRWNPGKNSAQLAKGHRPDICFPASGARLVEDFGQVMVPVRAFEIPFHHETFDTGGKLVHVFYCLWPDRVSPQEKPLREDGSQASRLLAVFAGKRNLGQQMLELVLAGPESEREAVAVIKSTLPRIIQEDQAR
jgi:exosortase